MNNSIDVEARIGVLIEDKVKLHISHDGLFVGSMELVRKIAKERDVANAKIAALRALVPESATTSCYRCKKYTPHKHVETPYEGSLGEKYGQVKTTIVCAICGGPSFGRDTFVEHLQAILYPQVGIEVGRKAGMCDIKGCGNPATCIGRYEEVTDAACCDEHCAHGQEDGGCQPIAENQADE